MAIGPGSLLEISLNMVYLAQQCSMVFQYWVETYPLGVSPVQTAEAWWNHVKVPTRALAQTSLPIPFRNVKIRELNDPAGAYATFDIPAGEQIGTRSSGSGDNMPPYVGVGVQLVVGTRSTRPGQKRHPFVTEGDNIAGALQTSLNVLTSTWAGVMTTNMLLGAPAATAQLRPIVTRKDNAGFVTAYQDITGFLVNPNLTTQNSRKIGRGI
jgi:hypothetical protein